MTCSYWDGAVLPIGLGLSLVINGLFIARHINKVLYKARNALEQQPARATRMFHQRNRPDNFGGAS